MLKYKKIYQIIIKFYLKKKLNFILFYRINQAIISAITAVCAFIKRIIEGSTIYLSSYINY